MPTELPKMFKSTKKPLDGDTGILDAQGPIKPFDDPVVPKTSDQLLATWKKTPSPDTLTPLMAAVRPVIQKAMLTYGYAGDPNIEMGAQRHVISVLPRYDPKKAKLETFLTNELRRVQRIGMGQRQAVKIPEQAMIDWKYMKKNERELSNSLGREPTVEELADTTGLSIRRLEKLRTSVRPTYTEAGAPDGDEGHQLHGSERASAEDLWTQAFYGTLEDPIDKKIFEWSTGYGGTPVLSKTEMAKRLQRSVPAISQRSEKLSKNLEELVGQANRII